jgi:hypothetical protein
MIYHQAMIVVMKTMLVIYLIYNYKRGVCACVYASVRPSGILLAGTQGDGYNSVSRYHSV